jgi:hypothetical protein
VPTAVGSRSRARSRSAGSRAVAAVGGARPARVARRAFGAEARSRSSRRSAGAEIAAAVADTRAHDLGALIGRNVVLAAANQPGQGAGAERPLADPVGRCRSRVRRHQVLLARASIYRAGGAETRVGAGRSSRCSRPRSGQADARAGHRGPPSRICKHAQTSSTASRLMRSSAPLRRAPPDPAAAVPDEGRADERQRRTETARARRSDRTPPRRRGTEATERR